MQICGNLSYTLLGMNLGGRLLVESRVSCCKFEYRSNTSLQYTLECHKDRAGSRMSQLLLEKVEYKIISRDTTA